MSPIHFEHPVHMSLIFVGHHRKTKQQQFYFSGSAAVVVYDKIYKKNLFLKVLFLQYFIHTKKNPWNDHTILRRYFEKKYNFFFHQNCYSVWWQQKQNVYCISIENVSIIGFCLYTFFKSFLFSSCHARFDYYYIHGDWCPTWNFRENDFTKK